MKNQERKTLLTWPAAIILCTIIIALTLYFAITKIVYIFTPHTTSINITQINSAVKKITQESKIVLMTAVIDLECSKSSEKHWQFWKLNLNLGKTVVRMRIPGNKVQFIIPQNMFNKIRTKISQDKDKLTVFIPHPIVDKDMIAVQANHDKIELQTKAGWGRSKYISGSYLEKEIKKHIIDAIYNQASADSSLKKKADESAKSGVQNLICKYTGIGSDAITIKFTDE
jgi:hypothetical protein